MFVYGIYVFVYDGYIYYIRTYICMKINMNLHRKCVYMFVYGIYIYENVYICLYMVYIYVFILMKVYVISIHIYV